MVIYNESDITILYGKAKVIIVKILNNAYIACLAIVVLPTTVRLSLNLYLSAIYNKIWLFGGHDKETDVVEVFDTIKGVSFDTNIYFNSTQGMKYPSSVIIHLP